MMNCTQAFLYMERTGQSLDQCVKDLEETGKDGNWNPPPRQDLLSQFYQLRKTELYIKGLKKKGGLT